MRKKKWQGTKDGIKTVNETKRTKRPAGCTKGKPLFDMINLEQVYKLAAKGFTQQEMADFFDVTFSAFEKWAVRNPDFAKALKVETEHADSRVVRSLYESALGFTVKEEKVFVVNGELKKEIVKKQFPPNVSACTFWLKNRQKDKWRDIWKVEHSGPEGAPIPLTAVKMEPEEAVTAYLSHLKAIEDTSEEEEE